jgi:hypothetical protein
VHRDELTRDKQECRSCGQNWAWLGPKQRGAHRGSYPNLNGGCRWVVRSGSGEVILVAVWRRREVTLRVPWCLSLGAMAVTYPSSARHKVRWLGWCGSAQQRDNNDLGVCSVGEKAKGVLRGWCGLAQQQDSTGNQFHNAMMEWDETITGIDGCLPKLKL